LTSKWTSNLAVWIFVTQLSSLFSIQEFGSWHYSI